MFRSRKPSSVVGLDFETGSVAATELAGNGSGLPAVARAAIAPLEPGVVGEGEVRDVDGLAEVLKALFSEHKLGKEVRLGVANQRVVMRTLRLPMIEDPDELETAVRFQAQDQIPMPLDQAVLDHQVVSRRPGTEGERQMQVVAVAARRDMVTSVVESLRRAGLRAAGIDLAAFGMIRALGPAAAGEPSNGDLPAPTVLYCYFGDLTNLAVAQGGSCLFTRVATFGVEGIASRVAESEGIPVEEARDRLLEVGLDDAPEPDDPDSRGGEEEDRAVREALEEGSSKLADELRVSLDFYGAQEGAPPIDRVVVCGPGSTIPGLPERIQAGLGLEIETRSAAALSHLDEEDAARLTVSYGLALGE